MDMSLLVPLGIVVVFLIWGLSRKRIRHWASLLREKGVKTTFHLEKCSKILKKLYENINTTQVSLKARDELKLRDDSTYTYGEVTFYTFVTLLEIAKAKPEDIFYDLGSGAGKPVFIAGLVYDFQKVYGVEKLSALYDLSQALLQKLKKLPELHRYLPHKKINIEFRNEDILECDLSDADIVFLNATCFGGEFWDRVVARLTTLKKGSRVIVGTQYLPEGGFHLIHTQQHLMSWGLNTMNVYEKVQ